jgi:hypothetical protein
MPGSFGLSRASIRQPSRLEIGSTSLSLTRAARSETVTSSASRTLTCTG